MQKFLITVYVAISLALMGTIAHLHAEEVLLYPSIIMTEGLICDTPEQVAETLQNIDEGKDTAAEGCGRLMIPVPVSVHRVGWYDREHVRVEIVKFTHLISGEVQYGVGDEEKRPQGT